jgi:hypothetical protein
MNKNISSVNNKGVTPPSSTIADSTLLKDTSGKSLYVLRGAIDERVVLFSKIKKQCNKAIALCTQRRLLKSKLDISKLDSILVSIDRSLANMSKQLEKASVVPVPRKKTAVLEDDTDISTV